MLRTAKLWNPKRKKPETLERKVLSSGSERKPNVPLWRIFSKNRYSKALMSLIIWKPYPLLVLEQDVATLPVITGYRQERVLLQSEIPIIRPI